MNRAAVALALAGCLVVTTGAPARAQGDTAAVAINTRDGAAIFRFAFSIKRVMGEVVDQSNAAVAYSSCELCQTVAVSFQVLLIMSDPDVVTPTNLALAVNYECSLCASLASAYQYVFTTGGPLHFSADANQRIAEIRTQLLEILRSDLAIEEIQAQVDVLATELYEIVAAEVEAASVEAESEPSPAPSTPAPDASASAEPSPSSEPTASATPEPEPSPSSS